MFYSPSLILLDGTKRWIAGGPYTGEEREPNVIIAGDDRIAVDVVGASVIRAMGPGLLRDFPVWTHRQIRRAVESGLGARSPDEIEIRAEDATRSGDFRKLTDPVRRYVNEGDPERPARGGK